MVKKLISLLFISLCLGDTLILKDKTVYTGALIKFGTDEIIFKVLPSAKLAINISDIQELKLSDGTKIFENGNILTSNENHIKSKIQPEKAKQKSKYKELFIDNTKHNGFRKRNSGTQKLIQNSTLTLKDKSVYTGELVKYDNDEIKFRVRFLPSDTLPSTVSIAVGDQFIFTAKLSININDIQELKLWDGTKAFENGILILPEQRIRQHILIVKRKLFQRDAIKCFCTISILGLLSLIGFVNSGFDLGWPGGPWPGDGATMDG